MWNQQTRAEKTRRSRSTAALFLAWELQTYFLFLRTTHLRIVGLTDEISNKRIHNDEKISGNFSIHLPMESIVYHTLLFDYIRNNKSPNDSRHIMLFNLLELFLSGSSLESTLWGTLASMVCRVLLIF